MGREQMNSSGVAQMGRSLRYRQSAVFKVDVTEISISATDGRQKAGPPVQTRFPASLVPRWALGNDRHEQSDACDSSSLERRVDHRCQVEILRAGGALSHSGRSAERCGIGVGGSRSPPLSRWSIFPLARQFGCGHRMRQQRQSDGADSGMCERFRLTNPIVDGAPCSVAMCTSSFPVKAGLLAASDSDPSRAGEVVPTCRHAGS